MQATIQDAREVTKAIIEKIKPLAIILFGSVARQGFGNDLDILIVISDKNRKDSYQKVNARIMQILSPFFKKIAVEPFVIFENRLREYHRKGSHFIKLIQKEGKILFMDQATKEWMSQAEEELKTGIYLFEGKFYKGACFHFQQSIEKSIKAILLNKGWELEKIHSIKRLVTLAKDFSIKLDIFLGDKNEENIIFIDGIYSGRYPGDAGLLPLGEPKKKDAERAKKIAIGNFNEISKHLSE
jgi:HEPN domain-containing protein/predicted nucleotidyltransferase